MYLDSNLVFVAFLIAVTKYRTSSNLGEQECILAYSLRVQPIMAVKSQWHKLEEATGHMVPTVKKQKAIHAAFSLLFPLYSVQDPGL